MLRWGAGVAGTGSGRKMHPIFMELHPAKCVAPKNDSEIGMGPSTGTSPTVSEVDLFPSREVCLWRCAVLVDFFFCFFARER